MRAVGGKLVVLHDTLVFHPLAAERALFADDWSVQLADVASFEIEPVNLRHLLSGGVRKRLAVVIRDGRRELFAVTKPEEAARELSALAGVPYS
jgi:hypothetical protein